MAGCYYSSLKHSPSALPHHTLLEMNDVWSQCVLIQTSIVPVVLLQPAETLTAPDTPTFPPISWPVVGSRCHWQWERTKSSHLNFPGVGSAMNILTGETYAIFSNFLTCCKFPYVLMRSWGSRITHGNCNHSLTFHRDTDV